MKKNESAENYLETIYILSKRLPVVRSVDIATELNFKKPSVSVAMKHLREKELITVSDAGFITLTKEGLAQAEAIYDRHTTLTDLFVLMGVSEKTAAEDACLIEHILSEESFCAIKTHVKNYLHKKEE